MISGANIRIRCHSRLTKMVLRSVLSRLGNIWEVHREYRLANGKLAWLVEFESGARHLVLEVAGLDVRFAEGCEVQDMLYEAQCNVQKLERILADLKPALNESN